jgi:hypothetical protein
MEKQEAEIRARQELLEARACVNHARLEPDENQKRLLRERSKTHLNAVSELMDEWGLEPRDIGTRDSELSRLRLQSFGIPTLSQRCPP